MRRLQLLVGLVFAVAASTLCPLLVLGIWWRGLTAPGAAIGLLVGGLTAAGATAVSTVGGDLLSGWPAVILGFPAAVTVPLAFGAMILASLATAGRVPADVGRLFTRMHAPERFGVGVDRIDRIEPR